MRLAAVGELCASPRRRRARLDRRVAVLRAIVVALLSLDVLVLLEQAAPSSDTWAGSEAERARRHLRDRGWPRGSW